MELLNGFNKTFFNFNNMYCFSSGCSLFDIKSTIYSGDEFKLFEKSINALEYGYGYDYEME